MAKKELTCPVCKEKIFLKLSNHKYLYPWDGDNKIGKTVHKGCIRIAIEKGFYKEPKAVKPKYDFNNKTDYKEDSW